MIKDGMLANRLNSIKEALRDNKPVNAFELVEGLETYLSLLSKEGQIISHHDAAVLVEAKRARS